MFKWQWKGVVRKLAGVFGLGVLVLSLQYAFGVGACV